MAQRLVVIGGGISGLAAAHAATALACRRGSKLEIVVLEREREVGGKACSMRSDGWLVEGGPTGFLSDAVTAPVMQALIDAAGVQSQMVSASAASASRYIVRGGHLRRVNANPFRFAVSGLLGPAGLLRLAAEPLVPARKNGREESVWEFAARRIGRQAADHVIAPMVLGVFAGDAHRLSLGAAFPRLAALERDHGSLVKGMLAGRNRLRGGPAGPSGALTSLREGLQVLALELARRGRFLVRRGAGVRALLRGASGGWQLCIQGDPEPLEAAAVVLAGEAWAMAPLLRSHAPAAATGLASIACPPVAVVALGFGSGALERVPRGFGVLVPRTEGCRILGCLWESYLFGGRAPAQHLLVRAMVGGAVDPEGATLDDASLLASVRADLARLLKLHEAPVFQHIIRWPQAIPQYELGHIEKAAAIERDLARLPGLFLAGNALHGIAFAKSAALGWSRGEQAATWLLTARGLPGGIRPPSMPDGTEPPRPRP